MKRQHKVKYRAFMAHLPAKLDTFTNVMIIVGIAFVIIMLIRAF